MTGVVGHRQGTDAYLAALARHHGGKVATFDQALAALHPDVSLVVAAAEGLRVPSRLSCTQPPRSFSGQLAASSIGAENAMGGAFGHGEGLLVVARHGWLVCPF